MRQTSAGREPRTPGETCQKPARLILRACEYGITEDFEALVAEICAKFLREFAASTEPCWIAELGDEPVGSIMLVRGPEGLAQ